MAKIQNLISAKDVQTIKINPNEEHIYVWRLCGAARYVGKLIFELAKDAKCTNIFLFSADEDDEYNLDMSVNHKGANSVSRTLIRGMAKTRSKVLISGIANIHKEARHAEAWLDGRAILSDEASCRIEPRLEILTSEVDRAGHAATVSRISEEELFYMAARGIDKAEAERLKTKGFLLAPLLQNGLDLNEAQGIIKPLLI